MARENTPAENGNGKLESFADELRRESERLRELAEKLKAREKRLAEMEENYDTYKQLAFERLREMFKDVPPLPEDGDLEKLIQEEGGLPLEAFIHEFEDDIEK